jgi:hypothetical protein
LTGFLFDLLHGFDERRTFLGVNVPAAVPRPPDW